MNPIQNVLNFFSLVPYAIGLERWIPLVTQRVICSVATPKKMIALTFDDGPNPLYTPLLLRKLAEHQVVATFFLLGRNLKRHPEIGLRIVQEGHEIGNHTYNHKSLPLLSTAEIKREVVSTHQLIAERLQVQPVFLRPPNGLFTRRVLDTLAQLSYRAVVGDVFPIDVAWPDSDTISQRVLRRVQPGSIIILHDGYLTWFDQNKSQTVGAMDRLIPRLQDQGYAFGTLSQLVPRQDE